MSFCGDKSACDFLMISLHLQELAELKVHTERINDQPEGDMVVSTKRGKLRDYLRFGCPWKLASNDDFVSWVKTYLEDLQILQPIS